MIKIIIIREFPKICQNRIKELYPLKIKIFLISLFAANKIPSSVFAMGITELQIYGGVPS